MKKEFLIFSFLSIISVSLYGQDPGYLYPMGIDENETEELKNMPQKAKLTRSFYETLNLPQSYSIKSFAPLPMSQSQFGTCSAWATAYTARTIVEAIANNWTNKEQITANAFTPAFTYRIIEPDREDCNGARTTSAVASLKTIGALPLKFWDKQESEFHCPDEIDPELIKVANDYKINDFAKLFYQEEYHDDKTDKVKLSLSNNNPVVISMICPRSFHSVMKGLWEPEENPAIGKHGRHAMAVVSYDNEKYGGAFEIQNSWGPYYGDEGYVWIRYSDFNTFVYGAMEILEMPPIVPEEPVFEGSLSILNLDNAADMEVTLSDENELFNNGGETIASAVTYKVVQPVESGSKIRFYMNSTTSAYVYMLGSGSVDRSVNKLFPVDGISPFLNYAENEVAIPGEEYYFMNDETVGKDYIVLIFSKKDIEIDDTINDLESYEGTIAEKLKTQFGERMIHSDRTNFDTDSISFEAFSDSEDSLLIAIIEFNHI